LANGTFTCPRCFFTTPLRAAIKFCPRCGLSDAIEASRDTAPMEITSGGRTFTVEDRIAIGSIANIYRCRFADGSHQLEGIFKVARDPRTNHLLANEADVLRRLHAMDDQKRYGAFLPRVVQSIAMGDGSDADPRMANILQMHREIASPDDLYSLDEVRAHYPNGLDGRDVAWIWRRLLGILGYVHSCGTAHGAVLPMHMLIDPRDHKLLLVDWCFAVHAGQAVQRPVSVMGGGYLTWYKRDGATRTPPTAALDIAFGARCMIELLGGDPLEAKFPESVEPGLQRHLQRCAGAASASNNADAWRLLDDFNGLIEALWGPRKFRTFEMPRKGK
jgi:hypothetical protein